MSELVMPPGSRSSWITVNLTCSPSGSISNVTFERGSAASWPRASSVSSSDSAQSGVNVCHVYDSRRYGSDSTTTCWGSAIVNPRVCQVMDEPAFQSESNLISQ